MTTEFQFEEIIGESAALRRVLHEAGIVAPIDTTVLLLGETGTGKEVIARAIHGMSARRNLSFIKVPAGCWKASCSVTRKAHSPEP